MNKSAFKHDGVKDFSDPSVGYMKWVTGTFEETLSWKVTFSNPPLQKIYYQLVDITSRIHESSRSIGYAIEMIKTANSKSYENLDDHWVYFVRLDYHYFIQSTLIRIYGNYDNLGMVIQDLFEL